MKAVLKACRELKKCIRLFKSLRCVVIPSPC